MAVSNGTETDEMVAGQAGNSTSSEWPSRPQGTEPTPITETQAKILNRFSIVILTICFTMLLYGLITRPLLGLLTKILH